MTDYDAARSKLDKQDGIIVCKRSDGTYHYFHYKDFKQMIDYGELSFVITGDSSADDILTELKQESIRRATVGNPDSGGFRISMERLPISIAGIMMVKELSGIIRR